MNETLNETEVRVLGSLVEKALTTPDYYPMTLNGLTAACNQKNNREPIVSYDEKTVVRALDSLREKGLVFRLIAQDARVPKYQHNLPEILDIDLPRLSVLCVMMLRGPQTLGEIRGRTGRMCEFQSLEEVESVLEKLISREDRPLVKQLPRLPGQKEARFAHLLAGEPNVEASASNQASFAPRLEPAARELRDENARIQRLEEELDMLKSEMMELKGQFAEFLKQFD
jgi:uncharacterized protein YceH (UPF0502 family)